MHVTGFTDIWDTLFFGVPLLALLLVGFFRLDEAFATRKTTVHDNQTADRHTVRSHRSPMASDPDGRPWANQT